MTHFLRMILITTGIAGFSTIAAADIKPNGVEINSLRMFRRRFGEKPSALRGG